MTLVRGIEALRHPHRDATLVAWAQTPAGRIAVWVLAVALLAPRDLAHAAIAGALLAVVLAWPSTRTTVLAAGAGVTLWRFVLEQQDRHLLGATPAGVAPAAALIVLGLLYLAFRAAAAFKRWPDPIRRWPHAWLHAGLWATLGAAWLVPATANGAMPLVFRLVVACLPFLVWRCGYLLLSGRRGSASRTSFRDHLLYLMPSWGGTPVPYGKGFDYLSEADARNRAVSQLAGLKLLLLAWLWVGALTAMDAFVYGDGPVSLGLTRLGGLVAAGRAGLASPGHRWLSLVGELVRGTLTLAILGHYIIGTLRLFGFNVFRNTYKPLLSETLIDFWNRFYFYFKELLADFFFFPVYMAYFKRHPRLRVFAATIAAACLGNMYYHVLVYLPELAAAGPSGALALLAPRLWYSALLALGIFASLQRQQRQRGRPAPAGAPRGLAIRARRIAGVWLFYAIIQIWNVEPLDLTFAERTRFFLSLFGV